MGGAGLISPAVGGAAWSCKLWEGSTDLATCQDGWADLATCRMAGLIHGRPSAAVVQRERRGVVDPVAGRTTGDDPIAIDIVGPSGPPQRSVLEQRLRDRGGEVAVALQQVDHVGPGLGEGVTLVARRRPGPSPGSCGSPWR